MTQESLTRAINIENSLNSLNQIKITQFPQGNIELSLASFTVFLDKEIGDKIMSFLDQIKNELKTEFDNL